MTHLVVENLWKDFGGLEVLRGVDLTVSRGERHAIIGPNGSGKTTLINTVTGGYKPSKGSIRLDGGEIGGLPPFELARRNIARSFQIISVFPELSVFENVREAVLARRGVRFDMWRDLGGLKEVADETDALVEKVGLSSFRDVAAGELAYGRQRTLDLALTLALDAALLILDEPTAGIATSEIPLVTDMIRTMSEGRTLIMIEHDMDVVFAIADRVSVLCQGQILAQGPPEQIRNDQEVKRAYLGFREDDNA